MIILVCIFFVLTIASAVLWVRFGAGALLSAAITFGTFAYHFIMRLVVGLVYDAAMHNRADYRKRWYQSRRWEKGLYEKIGVKKWKSKMPTFDPELFDLKLHSWDEIAQAMCQAELVHETIMVLSLLPILAGHWFGAYPVFIITSAAAACIDGMFMIMQRYNRPRVIRMALKCGHNTPLKGADPFS